MPLDASIYDGLLKRPPPPESPIEMATKAADLRLALGRAQLMPAELQQRQEEAAQLHQKTQKAQKDAADEQTLQQIYGDVQKDQTISPDKKLDELLSRAAGKVGPDALEKLRGNIATHNEALQKTSSEKLKQAIDTNTEVQNSLAPVLALPPEQRAAGWTLARTGLVTRGVAKPEDVPEVYDENLAMMAQAHAQGATNSAKAELERREQANKDAIAARAARRDELATISQITDGIQALPPEQQQSAWTSQLAKLDPANQALLPAKWSDANLTTIKRMGLTAEQQQKADEAKGSKTVTTDQGVMQFNPDTGRYDIPVGNAPTKTTDAQGQFVSEYQKAHPGATIAQAQRAYKVNEQLPPQRDPDVALDREATRFAKPHEKSLTDATTQLEKISDARAMINGSAEAQALGIPKVLTALVSGAGSGVRITQAEINALLTARGIKGSLEGFVNSISGSGKLTDTQKQQVTGLLDDVADRVKQKQAVANDTLDQINNARSRPEIVKIDSDARRKLTAMGTGGAGPKAVTNVPDPVKALLSAESVKPGVHTLSDGSKWMKAADGTITRQ